MRTLSTDAAAVALGIERKALDNILAREGRLLLRKGSRGRSRQILSKCSSGSQSH